MSEIKVGDRVRDRFGILSLVSAINDKEIRYSDVARGQTYSTVPTSMLPELIEVAHYAHPGVSMVAMTPERIERLQILLESIPKYSNIGLEWSLEGYELRKMLAEARGEVKK